MDKQTVEGWLVRIREAAGRHAVSPHHPCGVVAQYNPNESKPWLLADDWIYEVFSTPEEAEAAARAWSDV